MGQYRCRADTYDGEVQAATFCLTGDGEQSPALEAGEFDTGFLEGLGALTPQTPPETRGTDPDRGGAHHHR